jgi:hypothetical protein
MSQFLKAHRTLTNPSDKDRARHYLFKVAQNYFPFYERFYNDLKLQDKVIFIRSCEEILFRIKKYLEVTASYRIKRDVKKAQEALQAIVSAEKQVLELDISDAAH